MTNKENITGSLDVFFKSAVKVSLRNPSQALAFFQVVRTQRSAARTREEQEKDGVHVPPIMLFSITNRCNLHCKGCYHRALRDFTPEELTDEQVRRIFTEASELGIGFIVMAGGEPMVRKDVIKIAAEFPDIIFIAFTNGTLIDEEAVHLLHQHRNIIPVVSMEGMETETDDRRGEGVFKRFQEIETKLTQRHIFWGASITVTRQNLTTVTDDNFMRELAARTCKMVFFVEYTPVTAGTEHWVITEGQREFLSSRIARLRRQFSALFVSVPGDEKQFGGCLAAGKGFVHVSASGDVEPCPFIAYSDANLKTVSLRTALQSNFLRTIREREGGLEEGEGGCSLWKQRAWLESLLAHNTEGPAAADEKELVLDTRR